MHKNASARTCTHTHTRVVMFGSDRAPIGNPIWTISSERTSMSSYLTGSERGYLTDRVTLSNMSIVTF